MGMIPLGAQGSFAPPEAEWCLRGYDGEGETLGYIAVRYERDTFVAGAPTKVLSFRIKRLTPRGFTSAAGFSGELLQQSGDSVFYYISEIETRVFLFKDNYSEGETTFTWLYNEPFQVSEVEERIFDGVPISVASMNLPTRLGRDLPVRMYGRWGPDRGFLFNWSNFLDGMGGEDLESVRAAGLPEIKLVDRNQCFTIMDRRDSIITVPVPLENCRLTPVPNPLPASGRLTIRTDCRDRLEGPFTLDVLSADGRVFRSAIPLAELPAAVDLPDLPVGSYLGVVRGRGQRYLFRFVNNN
ncbi:MAG: hypothetical protein AAFN92_07270 [Bacteroidota bacterium]